MGFLIRVIMPVLPNLLILRPKKTLQEIKAVVIPVIGELDSHNLLL